MVHFSRHRKQIYTVHHSPLPHGFDYYTISNILGASSPSPMKIRKAHVNAWAFLSGAGSGTRSAILGQYRRQPGELKKYSLDAFCPSGRSLRVPLISYQHQKKSPWLNTNSVSGAGSGTRTHTLLPTTDFESVTSANSIIPAQVVFYHNSARNAT